jgi:hypothetical protein
MQQPRRVRTHPLVALAVIAAAITTLTVFGKSAPAFVPAPVAVKKAHAAKPVAPSAVPGWLAASSAS